MEQRMMETALLEVMMPVAPVAVKSVLSQTIDQHAAVLLLLLMSVAVELLFPEIDQHTALSLLLLMPFVVEPVFPGTMAAMVKSRTGLNAHPALLRKRL